MVRWTETLHAVVFFLFSNSQFIILDDSVMLIKGHLDLSFLRCIDSKAPREGSSFLFSIILLLTSTFLFHFHFDYSIL